MTNVQGLQAETAKNILAEEANLLRDRAIGSARSLMVVIALITVVLLTLGLVQTAGLWFLLTSFTVLVTLVYAQVLWKDGIPFEKTQTYLNGHILITALTGILWSGFAIFVADQDHEIRTLASGLFLSSLTTGGVMAGTIYRPGYLALAVTSLVPFGSFLIAEMQGFLQIYGVFFLLYFVFCVTTNKHASRKTQEAILAGIERRAAETKLAKHEENQRIQEEKSRFVAAISHDMSQPMVAQRNLLDALAAQSNSDEQAALIQQLRKTQESQETFLKDLTKSNQLDEVIHALRVSEVSVSNLFDQLRAEFAPQCQEQGVVFVVTSHGERVQTDPHYVERILRNLISNALKYGADGGVVSLVASQGEGHVFLSVCDKGPGLDQLSQSQVFGEYVRLPRDEAMPGTGLGLSICRRLAEQLGGALTIQSELGQGTEMTLRLPLAKTAKQEVTNHDQKFALCIGDTQFGALGSLEVLFSSWFWEFAHGATFSEAAMLIESLRLKPDVILLVHPPLQDQDLAVVEDFASKAPLLWLQTDGMMDNRLQSLVQPIKAPRDQAEFREILTMALLD